MRLPTISREPLNLAVSGMGSPFEPALALSAMRCAGVLAVVIAAGTTGFLFIEDDWTPWQALYFTLITITTVGYGDQGLSPTGQKFAAVILILGIGVATYCFNVMVQAAVTCQLTWKKKMEQQIERLRDHMIICGFGRIGKTVCLQLQSANVPVVVIEQDERGYEAAVENGYLALHGNATEDDMLRKAGIERCRGVVCVVNSDAENIFIALSARHLNSEAFIACRAETEDASHKVQRAGASLVVSPHYAAGLNIAAAILQPNLTEFLGRQRPGHDDIVMDEITVESGSRLDGAKVESIRQQQKEVVFVALKRPDEEAMVRPHGQTVFKPQDVVIVAGRVEDLSEVRDLATPHRRSQKRQADFPPVNVTV